MNTIYTASLHSIEVTKYIYTYYGECMQTPSTTMNTQHDNHRPPPYQRNQRSIRQQSRSHPATMEARGYPKNTTVNTANTGYDKQLSHQRCKRNNLTRNQLDHQKRKSKAIVANKNTRYNNTRRYAVYNPSKHPWSTTKIKLKFEINPPLNE
jgi:hypothetical protein